MYIHNLKEIAIIIIFECIKIGMENSTVCVSADLRRAIAEHNRTKPFKLGIVEFLSRLLFSIVTFNLPVNDLHYCSFDTMYTWNCKASCYYSRKIYLI
jgi:hypothetical protein